MEVRIKEVSNNTVCKGDEHLDNTLRKNMKSYGGCGILIPEGVTTSYIYVAGTKPVREIFLDEDVSIIPVKSSPQPDDMIDCIMKNGNRDEFKLGILIATLRKIIAQLKIAATNAKELAIKTWNSQVYYGEE